MSDKIGDSIKMAVVFIWLTVLFFAVTQLKRTFSSAQSDADTSSQTTSQTCSCCSCANHNAQDKDI